MTGVAVDRLKENFAGEVVRPRDAEYDSLRAVFNGMIDRRPAAIARCTGAGAVGNAAVQLARWAGAEVMATVSDDAKAELATAPGAHHVVRYKEPDAAGVIRRIAPAGIDLIVEVAAGANAELDLAVLRPRGTISVYANEKADVFMWTCGGAWESMPATSSSCSTRLAGIASRLRRRHQSSDLGRRLRRRRAGRSTAASFPLEDTAAAHEAVENGAVGKVLITL